MMPADYARLPRLGAYFAMPDGSLVSTAIADVPLRRNARPVSGPVYPHCTGCPDRQCPYYAPVR